MLKKIQYIHRILASYLFCHNSQLSFWHEKPEVNPSLNGNGKKEYYMPFTQKALYPGPFDEQGIPLLDYHGKIGKQYNPIAISQYGLGNYALYLKTGQESYQKKAVLVADWLAQNLEQNSHGRWVWNHYFDFEYSKTLKAPWYSGLAQGQGISLLLRVYEDTGKKQYLSGAKKAFETMLCSIKNGGVLCSSGGDLWIEEYIVDPPTHILNGFIWALWGIYDYAQILDDQRAKDLWNQGINTLEKNLYRFDLGFWSIYDLSEQKMKMIASNFYHQLHIVQMRVMAKLTSKPIFTTYANRWENYLRNVIYRNIALGYKIIFKLAYF